MEDSYKLMDVAYMSEWDRVSYTLHCSLPVCLSVCLSLPVSVSVMETLISLTHTQTHTRLTALFSRITRVSWYQKGKTNLDFTEARDSEWQWHQLGHMRLHLAPDR